MLLGWRFNAQLLLLVLLLGALLWWQRPQPPVVLPQRAYLDPNRVEQIHYQDSHGVAITLQRQAHAWQVQAHPGWSLDQKAVVQLLEPLNQRWIKRMAGPVEPGAFGLGETGARITYKDAQGALLWGMQLGKRGTTPATRYVALADGSVVLMGLAPLQPLRQTVTQLRDRHLLPGWSPLRLRHITLHQRGQSSVQLVRKAGGWWVKLADLPLQPAHVGRLQRWLSQLMSLQGQRFEPYTPQAPLPWQLTVEHAEGQRWVVGLQREGARYGVWRPWEPQQMMWIDAGMEALLHEEPLEWLSRVAYAEPITEIVLHHPNGTRYLGRKRAQGWSRPLWQAVEDALQREGAELRPAPAAVPAAAPKSPWLSLEVQGETIPVWQEGSSYWLAAPRRGVWIALTPLQAEQLQEAVGQLAKPKSR
ncbi:hypothetical protein Mmc1_0992 [Magnetococcus marinus MC-1]|uniref:DUF4340 domain-containing protein n=1 Tax=Magnetococcus marinus (strain ATCC BAA-1437 / JCM 17883 / MC-1) TaxID=156889 RepID=A0L6B7_MAGMM|nr:DUF4340 domain-containing protein [Magnetococcus marinus]ABK43510.1 hypothetical protein Mmc1_0992 [Magnetococcus marinus MC-1]